MVVSSDFSRPDATQQRERNYCEQPFASRHKQISLSFPTNACSLNREEHSFPGCKVSQFYSLTFGQAVVSMY